jgi:hypothetical protein
MAEVSMINHTVTLDTGVNSNTVENQFGAANFTNPMKNQQAIMMADGGSDIGFSGSFHVPDNYSSGGSIIVKGLIDGAMSSVTLQFGIQGITKDHGEAMDVSYSTEDTGNETSDHADEDLVEVTITLSNFTGFAVGDTAGYYFFIDATGTYTGTFCLTDLIFSYTAS